MVHTETLEVGLGNWPETYRPADGSSDKRFTKTQPLAPERRPTSQEETLAEEHGCGIGAESGNNRCSANK